VDHRHADAGGLHRRQYHGLYLVNSILLRPLPYADPGGLYWVTERTGGGGIEGGVGADYYSLRKMRQLFAEVGAYDTLTLNWSGVEKPEQLDAAQVTPSFFGVLGVRPRIGRYLVEGEEDRDPLAVLSYSFWRNRLGSDPAIVGKTITLDGTAHNVIGVMPQGFDYPHGTQVWRPLPMRESTELPHAATRRMRRVYMIARISPAIPAEALDGELENVTRSIRAEYPKELALTIS